MDIKNNIENFLYYFKIINTFDFKIKVHDIKKRNLLFL